MIIKNTICNVTYLLIVAQGPSAVKARPVRARPPSPTSLVASCGTTVHGPKTNPSQRLSCAELSPSSSSRAARPHTMATPRRQSSRLRGLQPNTSTTVNTATLRVALTDSTQVQLNLTPLKSVLEHDSAPVDRALTSLNSTSFSPKHNVLNNQAEVSTPADHRDIVPDQEEMSPKKSHKAHSKVDDGSILGVSNVGQMQESPSAKKLFFTPSKIPQRGLSSAVKNLFSSKKPEPFVSGGMCCNSNVIETYVDDVLFLSQETPSSL
jgi:hypothetical protein